MIIDRTLGDEENGTQKVPGLHLRIESEGESIPSALTSATLETTKMAVKRRTPHLRRSTYQASIRCL